LQRQVRFLGTLAPDELKLPLSAADLFVLATRNEGWANVLLEAMACGLPVVTTDVGGNREVICNPRIGKIVPFGDGAALADAITQGLTDDWDRDAIVAYANANSWSARVPVLISEFRRLAACMD
jgi:glycosyltransferase involved in cell wall biosynthesis